MEMHAEYNEEEKTIEGIRNQTVFHLDKFEFKLTQNFKQIKTRDFNRWLFDIDKIHRNEEDLLGGLIKLYGFVDNRRSDWKIKLLTLFLYDNLKDYVENRKVPFFTTVEIQRLQESVPTKRTRKSTGDRVYGIAEAQLRDFPRKFADFITTYNPDTEDPKTYELDGHSMVVPQTEKEVILVRTETPVSFGKITLLEVNILLDEFDLLVEAYGSGLVGIKHLYQTISFLKNPESIWFSLYLNIHYDTYIISEYPPKFTQEELHGFLESSVPLHTREFARKLGKLLDGARMKRPILTPMTHTERDVYFNRIIMSHEERNARRIFMVHAGTKPAALDTKSDQYMSDLLDFHDYLILKTRHRLLAEYTDEPVKKQFEISQYRLYITLVDYWNWKRFSVTTTEEYNRLRDSYLINAHWVKRVFDWKQFEASRGSIEVLRALSVDLTRRFHAVAQILVQLRPGTDILPLVPENMRAQYLTKFKFDYPPYYNVLVPLFEGKLGKFVESWPAVLEEKGESMVTEYSRMWHNKTLIDDKMVFDFHREPHQFPPLFFETFHAWCRVYFSDTQKTFPITWVEIVDLKWYVHHFETWMTQEGIKEVEEYTKYAKLLVRTLYDSINKKRYQSLKEKVSQGVEFWKVLTLRYHFKDWIKYTHLIPAIAPEPREDRSNTMQKLRLVMDDENFLSIALNPRVDVHDPKELLSVLSQ